jgi:orotidine 5'-phosphate decarboxylase subfamily 2
VLSSFFTKLEGRCNEINSLLCVGLDPHMDDLKLDNNNNNNNNNNNSETVSIERCCDAAFTFCKTIIDATLPYACCYKPNVAFFEALGDAGFFTLKRVLQEIPLSIPVILDVKRGDIGSTAEAYAQACFNHLPNVDAVTLSPLMGWDSIAPFVTGTFFFHFISLCTKFLGNGN